MKEFRPAAQTRLVVRRVSRGAVMTFYFGRGPPRRWWFAEVEVGLPVWWRPRVQRAPADKYGWGARVGWLAFAFVAAGSPKGVVA